MRTMVAFVAALEIVAFFFGAELRVGAVASTAANAPFMGQTGAYSGQFWLLTPLGDGYFRLTNRYLGHARSLDTYGGGDNTPFMGHTGNYSGQYWKITPLGDGTYRLTSVSRRETFPGYVR